MHEAVSRGDEDLVSALVAAGADPAAENNEPVNVSDDEKAANEDDDDGYEDCVTPIHMADKKPDVSVYFFYKINLFRPD